MSFKKPFFIAALVVVIASGAFAGYIFSVYAELPDIRDLQEFKPPEVTKIYAAAGALIAELFIEKRELADYDQIPQNAVNAIIATEDAHFFEHRGVRVLSILRAIVADVRAGKFVQGGSTITQQLAKTLFLTPEKSLFRKFREMLMAMNLEINYTKKEILTFYFNQIYFGSGAYGIKAAAQVYFDKKPEDLTLAECALLAGLPKAPSYYSPNNDIERAKARRATVLRRMFDERLITGDERTQADAEPIRLAQLRESSVQAPYFVERVRQLLEQNYGTNAIYRMGLEVYTTLNVEMQNAAEQAVQKGLNAIEGRIDKWSKKEERPPVHAALIAIEPSTGYVKAMVGGRDFYESPFNRAVQARRQPGSAFKPIVYAAALEAGWTPAGILFDSPIIINDPSRSGDWKPTNFSKRFYGPVTLRRALEKSINVASVKLLRDVGIEKTVKFAQGLGITTELRPYLSLALGGSEVTLADITGAYAVFANHGQKARRIMILSVKKKDGTVLEENRPQLTEAMSEQSAFLISKMLQGVIENGTGRVAQRLKRPAGAKTGTTDDFTDAWFVGFVPQLATGVWVGYDMKKTLGKNETGARVAGPIWTEFMINALGNTGAPVVDFQKPEKITAIEIDTATGLLPGDGRGCGKTMREYFVQGAEPSRACDQSR